MGDDFEGRRGAELYALASDDNLAYLLAWRLVKKRAEEGGFNGLLASDLTTARVTIEQMLARVSDA